MKFRLEQNPRYRGWFVWRGGQIEKACLTLWGAKWACRRLAKRARVPTWIEYEVPDA